MQAQPGPEFDAVMVGVMLVAFLVVFLIALAITIFVLYLLYRCYDRIPAQHRQMEPWQVWLLLIPCFNLVWNFFVFPKLSYSYQSYFNSVGRNDVGDCGYQIGLWYAICTAVSIIPFVNYLSGPASLVLLIIFLVKAWTLRGQIGAPAKAF